MLNRVVLMGRITDALEVRETTNGNGVLSFSLAVDRYVKDSEKQTDFIKCVVWGNLANFIASHFAKGSMIAVEGNLRTRSYDDKNGSKHHVTEVYVTDASFTGERRAQEGDDLPSERVTSERYDGSADDDPF